MMDLIITPLPCGCVVVVSGKMPTVVECPWCGATFGWRELSEWFVSADPPYVIGSAPLVRFGSCVLELRGRCGDCGAGLAREAGSSITIHLRVPSDALAPVRN